MKLTKTLSASVAAIALTAAFGSVVAPTPAFAQQTTSEIRGSVTSADGSALPGAQVTIVDTRTGAARTTTSDANGNFAARGLSVGGPYTVTTSLNGFQTQRLDGVRAPLGSTTDVDIQLNIASTGDEIVVVASRSNVSELAIGPNASFDLDTLEALPSIDRDIRDIIRLDPRVTIDGGNEDSISCLGGNNRFNSFTVDGARNQDGFGVNASGFPNRNNLPIPFDAVRETSVEFAPFDVEYGQFTGCNINVVTKSGTNEFSGSAFAVFNSSGLTGSTIDGRNVSAESFKDYNWGATLGGPIIKDKLWFFAAYEEVKDGGEVVSTGPVGAGFANELDFITLAQADQIADILQNTYGRDALGLARLLPDDSRRILGRIDWQINDDHRLEATYSRLREARQDPDDAFSRFTDFTFLDNFEIEGTESENYSVRLFSQWSDNFSTEVRASRIDVVDIQNPVGGGEAQDAMPRVRLQIDEIMNGGETGNFLSGPGFSRSANALEFQTDQLKFKADYVVGNHVLTAGYELDQLDVFNLFVQDATGTIRFDDIAAFQAGTASRIDAQGSFSGDINDAAAEFSRSVHTFYLQDEFRPIDELTITLGLRYDLYKSNDRPNENPIFEQRFGFSNTQAFQGLDILQPRFGFIYDAGETWGGTTQFRGGIGVFSGGDPTVWFANSFQNFGGAIGRADEDDGTCTPADLQVIDGGGNFTGIPDCLVQAIQDQANANLGPTAVIDPDFDIPHLLRFNFGFSHFTDFGGAAGGFFDDWNVQVDFIHSIRKDAPNYIDLALTQTGEFAPDGRPIFNDVDPLLAGCDATFNGIGRGFSGSDLTDGGPCDGNEQNLLLTNVVGDGGGATTASIALSKTWDYEIGGIPGSFDFTFGYAHTDATDVNPTTNSTASSNYENVATAILNNPPLANSQFFTKHNITLAARFSQEFIEDYPTSINIFYNGRSGRHFSYAFDAATDRDIFGDSDDEARSLLYVPTGPADPLIDLSLLSPADQTAFFAFLEESGLNKYAGGIAPRNAFMDPWFNDLDIRFAQDIPGFFGGHRAQIFVDIENALNLIDDGANRFRDFDRGNVPEAVPIIGVDSISGGRYVLTDFEPGELQDSVNQSLWAVQIGFRYDF